MWGGGGVGVKGGMSLIRMYFAHARSALTDRCQMLLSLDGLIFLSFFEQIKGIELSLNLPFHIEGSLFYYFSHHFIATVRGLDLSIGFLSLVK